MIALGAKYFSELDSQFEGVLPNPIRSSRRLDNGFTSRNNLHPKIDSKDIFKSGYLLPNQTIKAITNYNGTESKIKKIYKNL